MKAPGPCLALHKHPCPLLPLLLLRICHGLCPLGPGVHPWDSLSAFSPHHLASVFSLLGALFLSSGMLAVFSALGVAHGKIVGKGAGESAVLGSGPTARWLSQLGHHLTSLCPRWDQNSTSLLLVQKAKPTLRALTKWNLNQRINIIKSPGELEPGSSKQSRADLTASEPQPRWGYWSPEFCVLFLASQDLGASAAYPTVSSCPSSLGAKMALICCRELPLLNTVCQQNAARAAGRCLLPYKSISSASKSMELDLFKTPAATECCKCSFQLSNFCDIGRYTRKRRECVPKAIDRTQQAI